MLKNLMMGAAALALSVTSMAGAANALIIDDFGTALSGAIVAADADPLTEYNASFGRISVGGGSSAFDRSSGAGILGGDRELVLDHTNTDGAVNAAIASGKFSHSNDSGATGSSLLRWDGLDGGDGLDMGLTDGSGGIDLTSFGSSFHLTVISADITGSSMEVRLYTGLGKYSVASVAIPPVSVGLGNSPFEFYLSLAAIQASGQVGGGVDLTDVRAIEWFADGSALGFDATVDIVDIVPEPASLTLLGAGIMGLGYFGRRNRKA